MSHLNFPRRAIHFDFHSMPGCTDICRDWDASHFIDTLLAAKVEFVNFFAKCNRGFCYYPSKLGSVYPGLQIDLLGEVVKACNSAGIKVSAYFNVGLSHEQALRHRDWCVVNAKGQVYEFDKMDHWFRLMCFNSGYRPYILSLVDEVLRSYELDGLIFDSMNVPPCWGIECIEGMEELGLDPKSQADCEKYAHHNKLDMQQALEKLALSHNPALLRYYLGIESCFQPTHVELEVLPQGGWGYDYLPSRIRYIRTLGKPYSTMTGRFQRSWADLGGLRPEAALFYDCANSVANGGACCIGDHLHPRAALLEAVYKPIKAVYQRLAKLDEWCDAAKSEVDMAILVSWLRPTTCRPEEPMHTLAGASRMLLEAGFQYDVVDAEAELGKYKVLFLPDEVRLSAALAEKLQQYLAGGGKIVSSAWSGMSEEAECFALPQYAEMFEFLGDETKSYTFLHCQRELSAGIPDMGLSIYEPGIAMRPLPGARSFAALGEPYFNLGHWDYKHEYLYIPEKGLSEQSALVSSQDGSVWHIAFPLAINYYKHAPLYCRQLLKNILDRMIPEPLLCLQGMPSYGFGTVCTQPGRRILHLLCYVPEKRGDKMEIIEEPSLAIDLQIKLRLDGAKARQVYLAPEKTPLDFQQKGDYAYFSLPILRGYQMIVCELA